MNIDKIDLDERIKYFENHLDEAQIIMTASLEQFIKTFHYIRKNEEFQIKDFHLKVIAELEDLVFGQQKNLLIEMPPRAGKSDMIDYFICWTYIINPNCNYIVTCYNDDLVGKFSKTMRSIIESDLYQKVFKIRMSSDTHSVGLWKIKDGGELRAISINGGITGFGAGIKGERYGGALIIDDPLKATDAKSEVKRKSVIDAYSNTLKSRLNNLDLTPTIVIMQRLHKQDLAGYLENEIKEGRIKNWRIIKVKAIKEDGTSFWEESYSLKSLEDMRVQHPYTFYSQYQQEPINESTSKFKDTMFEEVGMPDEFDYSYIIADTTYKDGQDNDYTVFTCFGVKDKKLYLTDIIRQKIQAVDIEKWCIPFIKKNTEYGFEGCYIEPKGHGIYLNQSLPKQNIMMPSEDEIAEFFKDRKVGKVERSNAIIPFFTNNKLYINRDIEKGMKNDIIGECISFPDGEHDDIVDTIIDGVKKYLLKEMINDEDGW